MRRTLPGLVLFLLFSVTAGYHAGRVSGRLDRERDSRADASMRFELLKQDLPREGRYSALVAAERLGYAVTLPRSPLEPMAIGLAPAQSSGRALSLLHGADWSLEAGESALFLRTLHLDPTVVLLFFLPVIVLCGPRLSLPILAGAVVVTALLSLLFTRVPLGSGEAWWRFSLWTLGALASAWLWTGVRVWCDRHREPERAAIAAYVALVLLLPGFLSILPGLVAPPPSAAASVAEIRKVTSARLLQDSARLGAFHETHPDMIEGADTGIYDRVRLGSIEAANQSMAPILERYRGALTFHRMVNDGVRLLSPVTALQGALLEAAGTGGGRAGAFEGQVDRFIAGPWLEFFGSRARGADGFTAADFAKVPPFRYEPEGLVDALMRIALPLAAVVVFGFLFRVLKLSLPY